MKILLLSTSMGMGGADKLLLTAAQTMRSHEHEVRIVSLTELGPMGHQARDLGIPTESLHMRPGVPDPRGLLRLIRMVRSWRPEIVHSHMVHANIMARLLRLFATVPVSISTVHNIYEGGPLLMAWFRLTNKLADHVTIVSEAAADRFIRERIVPRHMVTVIPNGVDIELFEGVPPEVRQRIRQSLGVGDRFVWLAVGRFEVAKDYPNMLQAFSRVHASQPAAILLLVGRGSLQAETEALTRELELNEAVRFLGVRHDVPEVMSAADGYVMSSAYEGMPMVLLEAAAAALPIVATQVGGNQEVVLDRQNGYLAPPRDPARLAELMLRLMSLPEGERRSMGRRGREHVWANYSLNRVAEQWEEIYQEVLQRRRNVRAPAPALTAE
jgi:glycosyltransferase involved in cell wall biosynthesis